MARSPCLRLHIGGSSPSPTRRPFPDACGPTPELPRFGAWKREIGKARLTWFGRDLEALPSSSCFLGPKTQRKIERCSGWSSCAGHTAFSPITQSRTQMTYGRFCAALPMTSRLRVTDYLAVAGHRGRWRHSQVNSPDHRSVWGDQKCDRVIQVALSLP